MSEEQTLRESIEAAFERVVQTKSEDRKPLTLEDETEDNGSKLLFSSRFWLGILVFFGFLSSYTLRLCLNFTVVCMVNQTALNYLKTTEYSFAANVTDECTNEIEGASKDGTLVWTKTDQGLILSSYFWGYLITHLPGGWLAEVWGSKNLLALSIAMQALPAFFIPVSAHASPYLVLVLRIIQGLAAGAFYPACHTLWSKWAPPNERARLVALSYSGNQLGYVVTLPLSGLLCERLGWGSIFYLFGTTAIVWLFFWLYYGASTPDEWTGISKAEKQYIDDCLSDNVIIEQRRKELGTPWCAIFSSKAVWACIIAHTATNWGIYNLQTSIPSYMKEVLRFNIHSNGFISALPYLLLWIMINLVGKLADSLLKVMSVATVRKLMMSIGLVFPAVFLVLMGFVPCNTTYLAVIFLCLGIAFLSFTYSGMMVNELDIAYPFAGTLIGISYNFATISGIVAPYLTQYITQQQTAAEWRIVFYINAVIYALGLISYLLMAEGELQSWVLPYLQPMKSGDMSASEKTKELNNLPASDKLITETTLSTTDGGQ